MSDRQLLIRRELSRRYIHKGVALFILLTMVAGNIESICELHTKMATPNEILLLAQKSFGRPLRRCGKAGTYQEPFGIFAILDGYLWMKC